MAHTLPGLARELVDAGLLGRDQACVLLQEQKRTQKPLEELVVSFGFLDNRVLHDFLRHQNQIRIFCPKTFQGDPALVEAFPFEKALETQSFPLRLENGVLDAAMVDVHNVLSLDALSQAFPACSRVEAHLTPLDAFLERLDEAYGRRVDLGYLLASLESTPTSSDAVHDGRSTAQNFVDAILTKAVREKASDIHMEPDHVFVRVRLRIDGVLRPAVTFHKDLWSSICVCLKIMAGLNIAQNRLPQVGRFTKDVVGRTVDFRVSIHPTQHGESVVLRLLDRLHGLKSLADLGFSESQVDVLKRALQCADGMILLTGPTGSGKTTTLYSMLDYLGMSARNIMTLEEPIEYSLPGVRQSEVKEATGITFPEGVRSILRQDPDIILIGEIRDEDTATMAVRAAMTGHLVLSTLHTNDTLGVVQRLKDLGLDPHLLEGHLVCLVAQRLVRRLCPSCKTPSHQSAQGMGYDAVGCEACLFTGYKGRFAIGEVLPITLELEGKLIQATPKSVLLSYLKEQGVETLWERGMAAVREGHTSFEEVVRVVRAQGWQGEERGAVSV